MPRRAPHKQKSPPRLGSDRTGSKTVGSTTVAPSPEVGKPKPRSDPAPHSTWPRFDHPFADQLRADSNYVWNRMMGSVARVSTVADEVKQLRVDVDHLRELLAGGRL